MTPTFQTALITAVFVSQLLVLSFIVPGRMRRMFIALLQRCPPEKFPRLYPVPVERMQRVNRMLNAVNIAIGAGGAGLLVWGLWQQVAPLQLARWLIWCCCAQVLPGLLRLPWQLHVARAFRAMPVPAVRNAELRSWQLTEFVPPALIAGGLLSILVAMLSIGAVIYRGLMPALWAPLLSLVFCLLLLVRMLMVLSGHAPMPRPDPYMSADDLFRVRRSRLRILFTISLALGLYLTFMQAYIALRAPFALVYVCAAVSLLCQLLYLRFVHITKHALAARDLTPYQADAA